MRILILGGSSAIGASLVDRLRQNTTHLLGLHFFQNPSEIGEKHACFHDGQSKIKLFHGDLVTQRACHEVVDSFVGWAGGIDGLVQLVGGVSSLSHIEEVRQQDWDADIALNLSGPFFAAQRAMFYMGKNGGGRIVLTSTASARHGGGTDTLAYGVAKAGIECVTRGLARTGARKGVLVNAIAPGFIKTGFHERVLGRGTKELVRREEMIPLGRSGLPHEVAGTIDFLLSDASSFITGEIITVSGGDWL